jgi:O-antigen/teichoic acid export membrane protein
MILNIKKRIKLLVKTDHERSSKIKKNIFYSFFIKGASILLGLMLIPLTINYINPVQYGIWLTISAMVLWMNNFDVGLSHGLRNKLAHSLALGDTENSIKYVSTTYAVLFGIALMTFAIFFIIGSFFNWNSLFNVDNSITFSIWPVVVLALGSFCIQFFLQPINSILIATHEPFMASAILFSGQLCTFVIVFIMTKCVAGNLFILDAVMSCSPLLVLLIANLYLFSTSLKNFRPRFKAIDLKSARSLLNIGGVFFIIQMGALVIYQTDNLIITRILGPAQVTTFNIAYKYFSILIVGLTIVVTPYWSAFTDAYAKKDFEWIKKSTLRMRFICLGVAVLAVVLYLFAKNLYQLWIGNKIEIPDALSLALTFYIIIYTWQLIHCYILNGLGKLRLQLILVVIAAFFNIPLSVYLSKKIGLPGVVLANTAVTAIMAVFYTIQVNKIIHQKDTGVWAK